MIWFRIYLFSFFFIFLYYFFLSYDLVSYFFLSNFLQLLFGFVVFLMSFILVFRRLFGGIIIILFSRDLFLLFLIFHFIFRLLSLFYNGIFKLEIF